jgi:hypothetical protein
MKILNKEEVVWKDMWPLESFEKFCNSYRNSYDKSDHNFVLITDSDINEVKVDKISALIRIYIKKNVERQKYILALRFYSFGEFATVDIISTDWDNHAEIIEGYSRCMEPGWYQINNTPPFICVGGFMQPDQTFVGKSVGYGNNCFGWSSNDIANSALSMTQPKYDVPNDFFEFILGFMKKHKQQPGFYEKTYREMVKRSPNDSHNQSHLSSLLSMQDWDIDMTNNGLYKKPF